MRDAEQMMDEAVLHVYAQRKCHGKEDITEQRRLLRYRICAVCVAI